MIATTAPVDAVLVRMAILSINAAVEAAAGTDTADEEIVRAAVTAARALVRQVCPSEFGAPERR